jgi:hypothetical protein
MGGYLSKKCIAKRKNYKSLDKISMVDKMRMGVEASMRMMGKSF